MPKTYLTHTCQPQPRIDESADTLRDISCDNSTDKVSRDEPMLLGISKHRKHNIAEAK